MQATKIARAVSPREPVSKRSVGLDSHDAVATGLGFVAAAVVWGVLTERGWPLLGSYRGGIAVLAVLGIGMCASGAKIDPDVPAGYFLTAAYFLGCLATGLTIFGLMIGSREMFVGLAATIAMLWVVATTRHAFGLR